jgi:processive 1,2-diacylglycerol beta-glucosyltransferase
MISLRDKETGADVGSISEEQLRFLVDQLEEEFEEDRDYHLNQTTLDVMEQKGADPDLIALLRRAIGDREGIEIEWSRTE